MEDQSQGLRKGTWTAEEDSLLRKCIEKYGEGKWHQVPSRSGLNRCRKSCRLRWLNYLKPNIKRGKLSPDEVDLVIRLHKLLGNRWSLIAGRLPGRTANDVKNYWNTHLSKKQDQSSNSKIKLSTCNEKIITSPTEPVQRIDVIKPRPRSFSNHRVLNTIPEVTFSPSNDNNSNTSSNNKDIDDDDHNNNDNNYTNDNILYGKKTCDKDKYEVTNTIMDERRESMWWERLLDESDEASAAEEEGVSSWMNSAATFDVDLWNLLNK